MRASELGYRLQLNPNLNLQPTLQWIFDPSGREEAVPGILTTSVQISLAVRRPEAIACSRARWSSST